jgi:hypothetical protein
MRPVLRGFSAGRPLADGRAGACPYICAEEFPYTGSQAAGHAGTMRKSCSGMGTAYRIALQKLHAISTQKLWGSSLPRRESTEAAVFLRAQPHSFHVLLGGTSFAVTITRTHEKGG